LTNLENPELGDPKENLVDIRDLAIAYPTPQGQLLAVDGVNLTIKKGETLGLVGESGCGKTTLGLSLLGMNAPGKVIAGSINVDSIDVLALRGDSLRRYRWEKTSMVFQSAMNALDPVRTIESQIVETMMQHRKISKEEARTRVKELLELVNIDRERGQSYPHELSGGMKQRVVIVMAICLSPTLLIADEPTTALDVVVQAGVLRTLKGLQDRFGLTSIIISHDVSIMSEMGNRLAVMYAGKIVEIGDTNTVINAPQHPYTQALLSAVPVIGNELKIKGIPGSPPSLIAPPVGCRFAPRCPYAFQKCSVEEPKLNFDGVDTVACWLR
jgi:peptide/nickel transport system ATP-binding protein